VAAAPADLVQYGDYCHWLQGQQARQRAQLDYWLAQLAGAPQLHSLPLDHARPPRQGHGGRKLRRVLPAARLARVREQCGVHGVTLFMYLQTAFAAVLSLYANEADIVMGTPVAGRRHRDLGATVGLFVNTVVLRSQVDGHAGFAQLLAANRATIVQALEHQDLPFDDLLEHLAIPRSRAFSPLVQILFALQTQLGSPLELPGAAVADLPNDGEPVKVDLQLVAQEQCGAQCGELQLEWHYNASLFAPPSIARMADTLDALLDAVVAHPDTPLFELPLARHDARQAALRQAASAAPRQRLERMVAEAAARHPQRTAVRGPDGALTYAELERQATALAGRLHGLGVGRGSVAGLHLEQSPALLVAMLAVLKTGAAYLPLYPALPAERLQLMLDDSCAAVLVTASALRGRLTAACTVLIDDDAGTGNGASTCLGLPDSADLDAGDAAYVLYTSGTTGQPKGVIVAHAGVANLLDQMDALAPLPATNGPNGLLWSNMSFDVSVYEIYSMLCRGGTLHLVPDALRLEPRRLFQWMDEREIGSAFLHAAYLGPFGDHAAAGGGRALRRLLIGVEPIAAALVERIGRHLPALRVINGYGPTEATICCTLYPCGRSAPQPDAPLPIGRAVQGLELRVMNPAGGIAPPGAIGELYVAGIGLAVGYLRRPALDRDRFVPLPPDGTRFYRTGDLVRLNGDDELVFMGRCDRQVKVRGFRVELGEVETRLCQLPGIAEAAVLVAGEGAHGRLLAYVVTDDAARALSAVELEQQVRHGMRAAVPEYMVPARVIAVERMPRNASGKVHTALLPAPSDDRTVVAPRNAIETRLLRIWRDVLETDDLGVTDDFFAVGGQSLLAMLVLARTREQFGLGDAELSVTDLLDHPTIESFARTYALVLAAPPVREKIHYLSALADPVEEGVI
jgi:amino acid adenylation domain-containing protein